MSDASAYVLEEIQEMLEKTLNMLVSYSRKSSRAISARRDLEEYEKGLKEVLGRFERTVDEYPEDEEVKKILDRFQAFFTERHNEDAQEQKERISHILSDLKSMVHWRKMETAYGKTLGFSDFRSLRGESKKR